MEHRLRRIDSTLRCTSYTTDRGTDRALPFRRNAPSCSSTHAEMVWRAGTLGSRLPYHCFARVVLETRIPEGAIWCSNRSRSRILRLVCELLHLATLPTTSGSGSAAAAKTACRTGRGWQPTLALLFSMISRNSNEIRDSHIMWTHYVDTHRSVKKHPVPRVHIL